jgi:hypothetical protein
MRTLRSLATTVAFLCTISLAGPIASLAQSDSLTNDPGYVDLSRFSEALDMRPNIEVTIQGALLDMVRSRAAREDDRAAGLMQNLRSIQMRGFPTENLSAADYDDTLDRFADDLLSSGWDRVMHMREDNENVSLFMRYNDEEVAGLTLMMSDASDNRLMFINIVGRIQPDELTTIMGGTGVELDSLPRTDNDTSQNGSAQE